MAGQADRLTALIQEQPDRTLTELPEMNLVLAHKVDFDEDENRKISAGEFRTILQIVMESEWDQ